MSQQILPVFLKNSAPAAAPAAATFMMLGNQVVMVMGDKKAVVPADNTPIITIFDAFENDTLSPGVANIATIAQEAQRVKMHLVVYFKVNDDNNILRTVTREYKNGSTTRYGYRLVQPNDHAILKQRSHAVAQIVNDGGLMKMRVLQQGDHIGILNTLAPAFGVGAPEVVPAK